MYRYRGKELTLEEFNDLTADCYYHHTSTALGYQSVKCDRVEDYEGRYGVGYKVYSNKPGTTRYCTVSYYIEEECD